MFLRGLEGWHIVIIVLLIAVLFGAKRMPDAARSIGQSLRIFKSEVKAANTTDESAAPTPTPIAPVMHVDHVEPVEHVNQVEPVPASHAATPTR